MHKQTMVQVNVPVDEGIAPLVKALNRFDGLLTLESCEEGQDGQSYVAFTFSELTLNQQAQFLNRLSSKIGAGGGGEFGVALSLEWFAGGEGALAWIRIPPKQAERLSKLLLNIAEKSA